MHLAKKQIIKQLYHSSIAIICGCLLWYIIAEKIVVTHIKKVPIYIHNTKNNDFSFAFPENASVTFALSPSSLLSIPTDSIAIHLDADLFSKEKTVLTDYQSAIVLPKGIKVVHCNPIIIHKIEKPIIS